LSPFHSANASFPISVLFFKVIDNSAKIPKRKMSKIKSGSKGVLIIKMVVKMEIAIRTVK